MLPWETAILAHGLQGYLSRSLGLNLWEKKLKNSNWNKLWRFKRASKDALGDRNLTNIWALSDTERGLGMNTGFHCLWWAATTFDRDKSFSGGRNRGVWQTRFFQERINGDSKRVIWDCSLQSNSGHPFSSPLSTNSRNTVYKLRFANFLGRINGDLKKVIWDCSLQSDSEHPIFSPLSKNSRNTVYKLRFASLRVLPLPRIGVVMTMSKKTYILSPQKTRGLLVAKMECVTDARVMFAKKNRVSPPPKFECSMFLIRVNFTHGELFKDFRTEDCVLNSFNSVRTRGIVKTSRFTRGVCKNRWFMKYKGFLVEVLENKRSWENKRP